MEKPKLQIINYKGKNYDLNKLIEDLEKIDWRFEHQQTENNINAIIKFIRLHNFDIIKGDEIMINAYMNTIINSLNRVSNNVDIDSCIYNEEENNYLKISNHKQHLDGKCLFIRYTTKDSTSYKLFISPMIDIDINNFISLFSRNQFSAQRIVNISFFNSRIEITDDILEIISDKFQVKIIPMTIEKLLEEYYENELSTCTIKLDMELI